MSLKKGSKVEYAVGRGFGKGTIVAGSDGMFSIRTANGKVLKRSVDSIRSPGTTATREEE